MKKLVLSIVLVGSLVGFAQNRETVRPGDEGLKREAPPPQLIPASPDRPMAPIAINCAPFAVNLFSLSLPGAPELEIDGFRLNISVPFATPDHRDVFGFDLGLSGEAIGHVGGIAINLFDNWSDSFSGGCVGLVNATGELHGLQIGLVNIAENGNGLQIGLWNQSAKFQAPLIGLVW